MKLVETLLRKACELAASKLRTRIITRGDARPYLGRHYIFRTASLPEDVQKYLGWMPSIYLHHFFTGDDEPELHNHPWGKSISLILLGGYSEERLERDDSTRRPTGTTRFKTYKPGMLNFIRKDDFHKVTLLEKDAWTLFIAGDREQDWGFYDRHTQEFFPWREHVVRRPTNNVPIEPIFGTRKIKPAKA